MTHRKRKSARYANMAMPSSGKPYPLPNRKAQTFTCTDCKLERPGNVRRTVSRPENYRAEVCSTCVRAQA